MKQDEIRNEILPHCLNGTHADYATLKIMNLLSKKPSVSDEEIKDWADYTYPDIDKETDVYLRRGFFAGFKKALSLTPPDAEKWISVDEKPKKDCHCLVYLFNPNTEDNWNETAYFMDGYFYQTIGKQEYITHWMPLPKPPINKQGGK